MNALFLSLLINFAPSSCAATKVCIDVANDAGNKIQLYAYYVYPAVHLYIDGIEYDAPAGNAMTIEGLQLADAAGDIAILNASFVSRRVCVGSGRGQSCHQIYTLVSGSVAR